MVERVIHLQPQLTPNALSKRRIFLDIEVPDIPPWLVENVASGIAEAGLAGGKCSLHELGSETGCVEPMIHCTVT